MVRKQVASRFLPFAVLVACVISTGSCVSQEPVSDEQASEVELIKPRSKPVKMPPRLEIDGSSNRIAIDEFFVLQQTGGALIYDVRDPYFYEIDHIPGAINWPYGKYEGQVQQRDIEIQKALNSGKKVVLYCFSLGCPEARNVAKKLARRDYDVYVLTMGIDSWREAGLPVAVSSLGNAD